MTTEKRMPEPAGPEDERFVYKVTAAGVAAVREGAATFDSEDSHGDLRAPSPATDALAQVGLLTARRWPVQASRLLEQGECAAHEHAEREIVGVIPPAQANAAAEIALAWPD